MSAALVLGAAGGASAWHGPNGIASRARASRAVRWPVAMPESDHRVDMLRAGAVVRVGAIELLPIERTVLQMHAGTA